MNYVVYFKLYNIVYSFFVDYDYFIDNGKQRIAFDF